MLCLFFGYYWRETQLQNEGLYRDQSEMKNNQDQVSRKLKLQFFLFSQLNVHVSTVHISSETINQAIKLVVY